VTLFPTGTVPYDTEEGVEVSEGPWLLVGVVPDPEPLSVTVTNAVPLLLFRVRVPEKLPDAVGLKPTAKYAVAPPLREKGIVSELMLNAELLIDALVTVTLDVVKFLIASVVVTLFPTGTLP
jgi:hypothetical protein